jgi:Flp pilus assembly pilin Flp
MLLATFAKRSETPTAGPAATPPRRPRRAATAMEYLVVASFILVVLIAGVQHLGLMTGTLFQHDADATSVMNPISTGR